MKTIVKTKVTLTFNPDEPGRFPGLDKDPEVHFVPIDEDPLGLADCSTTGYDTEKITRHYCGKTSGPAVLMSDVLLHAEEKFLTTKEAQDILLNEVAVPFNQMKIELSNIAFNQELVNSQNN